MRGTGAFCFPYIYERLAIQTNMLTSKKGQNANKNDPYTRMERQRFAGLSISLPLMILSTLLVSLNPHNDLLYKVLFLILDAAMLIVGGIALFHYRSNLKHLDERRQRALQGDDSLLAREQPTPDSQILPLPTTIKLDQSRRAIVFLSLSIAFILFLIFVVGITAGVGQSHHGLNNHTLLLIVFTILGAFVVALLAAFILIFFLLRNQLSFTIVADEYGLSSTYQGITSTINWSDARLFAVLNQEKPSAMRFYELSNESTVVRWVNMPERAMFQRKENRANAEYRRKVLALLSLIAARTELPLYDLSPHKK